MPAYFDTGFSVRQPMWHGMGLVTDRYPDNWDEAREWGGLQWEPELRPVIRFKGDLDAAKLRVIAAQNGMSEESELDALRAMADGFIEEKGWRRICRSDTGATLGVRTDSYEVRTHEQMGQVVEALLAQTNVKFETAGSLKGGAEVWALAYLDEPIQLPGDPSVTLPYLALTNRHDGYGSLSALSTSVRIVCANTFSAAEAEGDRNGSIFRFRHTGSWEDQIAEAKKVIQGVRDDFATYVAMANELASIHVTQEQRELFVAEFIPTPPEGLISNRVMSNIERDRTNLRSIFDSPTTDGIRDTAFGLVQAAGEYLDHYRGYRTRDTYFRRTLLRPEKLKTRAVQLAKEVVTN